MAQKLVKNQGNADLKDIPIPGGTIDLKAGEEKVVTGEVAAILTRIFKYVKSEDYLEITLDKVVEEINAEIEEEVEEVVEDKPKVEVKTTRKRVVKRKK